MEIYCTKTYTAPVLGVCDVKLSKTIMASGDEIDIVTNGFEQEKEYDYEW